MVVWLFGLGFGVGFWSDVSGEVGRLLRLVFIELLELGRELRLFSRDEVGGCFNMVSL